jgi:hypothetical protein
VVVNGQWPPAIMNPGHQAEAWLLLLSRELHAGLTWQKLR